MTNPPAAPAPEPEGGNVPPEPAQPEVSAAPAPPAPPAQQPQYAPPVEQPQYAPPVEQPQYAPPQQYAPVPPPPAAPQQPQQAQQAQQPYTQQSYGQQPYNQQQYAQPQYAPPQYTQAQYTQPQYAPPQQYAQPQPQYPVTLPPAGPGEPFDGAQHPGELNRPLYGANMGQAFTRFFRNYANFSGRASRSEYWWMALVFGLGYIGLVIIAAIFAAMAEQASPYSSGGSDLMFGLLGMLLLIVVLGVIIPSLALSWRRLHDANLAGPLYLLTLIPYVGGLIVLIFMILSPKPEGRRFDRPTR